VVNFKGGIKMKAPKKRREPAPRRVEAHVTHEGIFIIVDSVKIAMRGRPKTPQARTWVSLEPGWRVFDEPGGVLAIEYQEERIH
jgi:hypothetical protein